MEIKDRKTAYEAALDGISAIVPRTESEYAGENGLMHCAVCHEPVQAAVEFAGIKKIVRCICKCTKAKFDEIERQEKQRDCERKRRRCFAETDMSKWNFENDDRTNTKLSNAMMRYAGNFAEFRRNSKGLVLFGTVGTGKTFYAACIANKLIDDGYNVLMTNFSRLTNEIQGLFDGRQAYIDSLNRYDLLVIDDLGTERKSANGYMQEIVFNIIDARYRSGLPLIVTTNLSAEELKKPGDIQYARIYDRILEMCFPIEVSGKSRRREEMRETYTDVKKLLGL